MFVGKIDMDCTEIVHDIRENPFNFQSRISRLTVFIEKFWFWKPISKIQIQLCGSTWGQ